MRQRFLLTAVLVAAVALTGCGKAPPREYTKVEFESYVAQKCSLKEVTLEAKKDGKFTGTGKDADGKTFQVEATQEANRITWKATRGEWKEGGGLPRGGEIRSGSESR